jgi:phosphinothricin acetyltransferase
VSLRRGLPGVNAQPPAHWPLRISSFRVFWKQADQWNQQECEEKMQIRDAVEEDFDQITEIYNEILMSSTAIYSDSPTTREERIAWWKGRLAQGYPVLVASTERHIAGFTSFGDFRPWPGYRFTVEGTLHIHSDWRGKGIGTRLTKALLQRAEALGKHTMIAGVDAENVASLGFLDRFGFQRAGCLREVGYKFDRFLDLIFLQYWITPPADGGETTAEAQER